jgi:hypothetical protein
VVPSHDGWSGWACKNQAALAALASDTCRTVNGQRSHWSGGEIGPADGNAPYIWLFLLNRRKHAGEQYFPKHSAA